MLNLERLGHLTTELSSSLVRSLASPGALLQRKPAAPGATKPTMPAGNQPGSVYLVGALPLPDDVVVSLIHQVGTRAMRVCILALGPAADEMDHNAAAALMAYGAQDIRLGRIVDRTGADSPELVAQITGSQVTILVGADPGAVRAAVVDTQLHLALMRQLSRNGILVAIGGAAMAAGDIFIAAGAQGAPEVSPGLRLVEQLAVSVVQAPFVGQGQLLHAMGQHLGSQYMGVGLDSSAAVLVKSTEVRVLGDGTVTFLDARDCAPEPEDTMSEKCRVAAPLDQPPVFGLKVHVLVAGYGVHLKTRRPLGPATATDRQTKAAGL